MISLWLLGEFSGVLLTCLSGVDVCSRSLIAGVCSPSFPTLSIAQLLEILLGLVAVYSVPCQSSGLRQFF